MDLEWLRRECLLLPHTTEHVRWEERLVFKVGGKMYAVTSFEPSGVWLSVKSSDEDFYGLVDDENVIPAPYLARAKWIALTSNRALPPAEVQRLLRQAHALVFAKLPKRMREKLSKKAARPARKSR
jgi:predicted DNA-binding protein (MmcQ/YjbR family)